MAQKYVSCTFYPVPLSEQIFHFSTTQEDLASYWLLSAGLASGNDAKYFGACGVESKYPEKDLTSVYLHATNPTILGLKTDCKQNSCYSPTDIKMFKNIVCNFKSELPKSELPVHSTLTLCYKMIKKALTYNWKV